MYKLVTTTVFVAVSKELNVTNNFFIKRTKLDFKQDLSQGQDSSPDSALPIT